MRSIWPKTQTLVVDFKERDIGVCMLSEVWEKLGNKKQQSKLEELLHMENIKYISTARPGLRRGGGAAIMAGCVSFALPETRGTKLPENLEEAEAISRKSNKD